MKEYVPGQGSYKAEEAGSLTGIDQSYDVDHNFGTLIFSRDDVSIKSRGVDFKLSSKFNSDHLYSSFMPIVSKSDGPAGGFGVTTPIPASLMTLPFNQANFYRIANGWSWNLPYVLCAMDIFKYCPGDGRIFDLLSTICQQAWDDGTQMGGGNHCWTEGYEVTYAPETTFLGGSIPSHGAGSTGYSVVTIVIPEIQQVIVVNVQRTGASAPYDFTPVCSSAATPVVYLSDGKVQKFTSKGLLASITDAANKNTLTYTYVSGYDALIGTVVASTSRKSFTIAAADYAKIQVGDLVIINDEIKVIFALQGSNTISTSSNFDVAIPAGGGVQYTILKGQIQEISHTDGRAVKFYYFASGANTIMCILLSSDPNINNFVNGDQFLGVYTIDPTNRLVMYQAVNSLAPGNVTGGFAAILAASPSTYYSPLQEITYLYNLTLTPKPSTDTITVINNAGAPTVYYFQAGGFCSHSWNNAFFHKGTCRRGGTQTVMTIERPDFYIGNAYNYISINRINQQAFYDASKADYQKDQNAAEFQENNNFASGMFAASMGLEIASIASAANPVADFLSAGGNAINAGIQAAQMGLQVAQYAHQEAQYANDAAIARSASNVSQWALVSAQVTANRLALVAPGLTVAPMQNDVFAVVQLTGAPDATLKLGATSTDSTKLYVDYTNGGKPTTGKGPGYAFAPGDWIFIRSECAQIQAVGTDTWPGASQNWIMTTNPLPFVADEGESTMLVYAIGGKIPTPPAYWAYYLNKPKVVRVEILDSFIQPKSTTYWKRIDYAYTYQIQGETQTDTFDQSGFDESNIEGPETTSFDVSDISCKSTTITVSDANVNGENDLYMDTYSFKYDMKSFHKGQDSVTKLRFDSSSNAWLFVNSTVNAHGRPCANAGYWGVLASSYYEGGDVTNLAAGGAGPRKVTSYRYDVYGRVINTRIVSPSYESRKIKNAWTQYVCTSQALDDLDPLRQFGANYLASTYEPFMNTFHALGVVGATIEEVDAVQDTKMVLNEYDPSTLNLLMLDTLVNPTLVNYTDLFSSNSPNFEAILGSTTVTNPALMRWSFDGVNFNYDLTQLQIGDGAEEAHGLTYFTYDPTTNNLLTIQRPVGNIYTLTYGTGWLSSYIATDYKTLPNNIGGTTQYIVNQYNYDLRGRLTSKITVLSTDTAGANPYTYGSSAPKSEEQYTYDGLDRLLSKAIGNGVTQTPVYQVIYMDTGDGVWEGPYMIETDYLGFRTKTFYDARYRVISIEKYKPSQSIAGNMAYANSMMANGNCESSSQPIILGQTSPAAPNGCTFAQSGAINAHGGSYTYLLSKSAAAGTESFACLDSYDAVASELNGLIAGHTYTLAVWVFVPSTGGVPLTACYLRALWNTGSQSEADSNSPTLNNVWQQISVTFTVPLAATEAFLRLEGAAAAAAGTIFYIDDITLVDITIAYEVGISANWNVYDEGLDKVVQSIRYTTVGEVAANSIVTKNIYDGIGRLLQVQLRSNDPNYQGDSVYHVVKDINYDEIKNGVITYDYVDDNALDYVETDTYNDWLGRGPVKIVTYTGLGGSGLSRTATNHYRHDGKLIKTDLPNGESFLYNYDNLGKLEKTIFPDGSASRVIYDLNGNIVQTIDRRNISALVVYNQSDMEVSRNILDAVRGNTVITTLYTQFGPAEVLKTENALSIVQSDYQYHWSGKVSYRDQIMDSYTMSMVFGYDAAGNLISITPTGSGTSPWSNTFNVIPQFHAANPDNDNFNREAVADNSTGNNIVTVEHDLLGNTADFKYGPYATPIGRMNYTYDKFLRQTSLITGESTPDLSITLTRDFIGKILSRIEPAYGSIPAVNNQYLYDGMNRLSSGEGVTEAYDELSNLVALGANSYIYQDPAESDLNDQMRLASFNNGTLYTYTCDSNGNPIAISNRFTSLSYDNLNALRQIVYSQTDNYWYVASGLRVKKTENAAGAWRTTYTMFDGDNPLMQEVYTASGRIQTIFNAIVQGKILAQYKMVYPSTLSVVYFYLDNLGSRRVVLSTAPLVIDRYHYSAWGVLTQDSGSDPYGNFTGKDYDATGLAYFNARYYDPVVGRFLTEDPSRQGVNWYAYCENDPVNRTDPTGKQDVPAMLAGAGMMLGGVAIGLATVLLDVGTGGVGVVADPLLIAASVSLFGAGAATWSAGAASKWIPPASRPGRGSSNAPPIHLPQVDPIGTPPDPPSPSGPGWKGGVAAAIGVAGAAGVLVDALKRPNAPPPPAPAPSTAPTFTAVPKATVKLAD